MTQIAHHFGYLVQPEFNMTNSKAPECLDILESKEIFNLNWVSLSDVLVVKILKRQKLSEEVVLDKDLTIVQNLHTILTIQESNDYPGKWTNGAKRKQQKHVVDLACRSI